MEKVLSFGTFNVPTLSQNSLSASFTAPALLPKEMMELISFTPPEQYEGVNNTQTITDESIKNVLNVTMRRSVISG